MSNANQTSALKLYSAVIEDVVSGIREAFADEGLDESILLELKQIWQNKLVASKAVDPLSIAEPQPPPIVVNVENMIPQQQEKSAQNKGPGIQQQQVQQFNSGEINDLTHPILQHQEQQLQMPRTLNMPMTMPQQQQFQMIQQQQQQMLPSRQYSMAGNSGMQSMQNIHHPMLMQHQDPANRLVPVQLSVPQPQGSVETEPKLFTIHVPASAIANNQLQALLTAPVITATMALPYNIAANLLQQHITAMLQGHSLGGPSTVVTGAGNQNNQSIPDNSGTGRQFNRMNQVSSIMQQVDGVCDTSDDEDDVDEICDVDDDDDDEDEDVVIGEDDEEDDEGEASEEKDDEETEMDAGPEEEPLNSEDDVSETDPEELFDTENVMVCQYDKVTRSRNKWKFYLKDGIMNLCGRDFVFQRANGEAEW